MASPNLRIVIQCRMDSNRLPGKAMLSICDMPAVVLCAKRAANTGLQVVVATSTERSDDPIAETVLKAGINVHRGPLRDVLARYVTATEDLDDSDFVVRYTADNLVPDGTLVNELMEMAKDSSSDLIGYGTGLPYGIGALAVRVKWLRIANQEATLPNEREHVMPWIFHRYPMDTFRWKGQESFGDLGHLRCTIDSLSDYLLVRDVFESFEEDITKVCWRDILTRIIAHKMSPQMGNPRRHGDTGVLQIGTAQLGQKYGVANVIGPPTDSQAAEIFHKALKHGVLGLDTAREYGDAETRIGALIPRGDQSRFTVVTKLANLDTLPEDSTAGLVRNAVDASVFRSCRELRTNQLDVLLLHRSHHLVKWRGAVWNRLNELHQQGVINQLGVSIYNPDEVELLDDAKNVQYLQLPINVLDRRWDKVSHKLEHWNSHSGLRIVARSVLLQGLLLSSPDKWPKIEGLNPGKILAELHDMVEEFKRIDLIDLCVAYVLSKRWVSHIVLGIENIEQLMDNILYVNQRSLSQDEVCVLETRIGEVSEFLVNPSMWKNT